MALRDAVREVFPIEPPLSYDADIDQNMALNLHVGYAHFVLACREIRKRKEQINNTAV